MSEQTASELIDLSANIRRFREQRGWTVRELAKRLNTSHPTIIRWEYPCPNMTLNSLEKLADVFGVTMRDLLSSPVIDCTNTNITYVSGLGPLSKPRGHQPLQVNPKSHNTL